MVEHTPSVAVLDRIDRHILDELQQNGRLSVAELARRVHLSATPCVERVRHLEREGVIRGYVAQLDPARLGFPVIAFVEVSLDRTTPDALEKFHDAMRTLEEVVECHMVAGSFDYLLKVRSVSMHAFRRFLGEKLFAVPGLRHTHTYLTLEELKSTSRLPLRGRVAVKEPKSRRSRSG
jgi:Lrp/AsnC family transcriptional regulator, leucine-responsive regulatory protein